VSLLGADVAEENKCVQFRIATELMPKGALSNHLSKGWFSSQTWQFKLKVVKGVCAGVQFTHSQNIIHMDLKSDNILLDNNNIPKIADFGIARYRSHTFFTRQYKGPINGDMRYCSPESCVTDADIRLAIKNTHTIEQFQQFIISQVGLRITTASDMFSLGIVCWEIAAGKLTGRRTQKEIQKGVFRGNMYESTLQFFKPAITGCIKYKSTDRLNIDKAIELFQNKESKAKKLDEQCRFM
jgi:serine/threonine protein kinase